MPSSTMWAHSPLPVMTAMNSGAHVRERGVRAQLVAHAPQTRHAVGQFVLAPPFCEKTCCIRIFPNSKLGFSLLLDSDFPSARPNQGLQACRENRQPSSNSQFNAQYWPFLSGCLRDGRQYMAASPVEKIREIWANAAFASVRCRFAPSSQ